MVQQQYGAQQGQPYNPYLQQPGQGQFAGGGQQMPMQGQGVAPPSWKGLKQGNNIPVAEFVGECTGFRVEHDQQYNSQNVFVGFRGVQVLKTDNPWPYAELELRVRSSESLGSGWGMLGESVALAMGTQLGDENFDIQSMPGHIFHMVRTDNYLYGVNQNNGQRMAGAVWRAHKIMAPGEAPVQVWPQYQQGRYAISDQAQQQAANGQGMAQQGQQQVQQVAQQPVQQTQQPIQQLVQQPVAQATMPAPVAADWPTEPNERAKVMLTGRTRSQFFEVALPDEVIRQNPELNQAIVSMSFIEAVIASGEFTEGQDGIFVRNSG